MPDWLGAQQRAHQQIAASGGPAKLKRGGVERDCTAGIGQFSTSDRQGNLIQWDDLRFWVSGYSLIGKAAPDNELDTLIFRSIEYKIAQPPSKLSPDGVTVLHYELVCRK